MTGIEAQYLSLIFFPPPISHCGIGIQGPLLSNTATNQAISVPNCTYE